MAQRFAGVAFVMVNENQLPLRGNFTVSPSSVERTMMAGQDGVHGYQELPRVPYIEGDISTIPGLNLSDIQAQVNETVIAQCANGKEYILVGACVKGAFEHNTRDGQFRVRWEGTSCRELNITGPIIP